MKIAFVSDAIYPYNKGGKEKRLYEISTRLSRQGHDVHIYTMHWWSGPEKVRREHGITLHALSRYYPMYKGETRSIKEGILFGVACLKLINEKWDVLDVDHMPFFPIYGAWLVCVLKRKKLYGTWHEALSRRDWLSYMGKAGYIASVIEYVSIRLPHALTAASEQTKELLFAIHKRRKGVVLVGSGVDTKLIRTVRPAIVKSDILYVGRFVKDKNVDLLIESVGVIAKSNRDIVCTIIGHGIEKDNLKHKIHSLNLDKNVTLLEPLAQSADIYAYMKSSKVFCLPSNREGFGIVVLEALACGTPVVTINSVANAAQRLIDNGINGSVTDADPLSLASGLNHWLRQTVNPLVISKRALEQDWDNLVQKQLEVYAQ